MAEIKKYLDLAGLQTLVTEVKEADQAVLDSAKGYANGLAKNYDASGSAATAKSEANAYTDQLANGAVATNTADIATLKGADTVEGSVAHSVKVAKDALQTNIDAVSAVANQNKSDIAAINNAETGILAQAKADATTKANAVQEDVDALSDYVGTIPEGATSTTVVDYVLEKTAGIATSENLEALTNRVTQAENDINTLETKATDLEAKDAELTTAIANEKTRAEGIEAGLRTDVDAIKADYLKKADKDALQEAIDANAGAIELLTNGVDAEKVDGVNDLIKYVEEHGTEVTGMQTDISNLKTAMTTAQSDIDNVEAAVATKAEQADLEAETQARTDADSAMDKRLKAVEAQLGDGENSVSDLIATAKQEAIDAAAADATTKANTAETNAKKYTDDEVAKDRTRLDALEAIDHSHANQAELDKIAEGDKAKWDEAAAKAHEHANSAELAKIADGDVAKWNAAEQNAKDFATGLNTTMQTTVDGVASRVTTLEETIVDKAEADDLTELAERVTTAETNIQANASAIAAFTAITPEEIETLFA